MAIDEVTNRDVLNAFLGLPEEKQINILRRLRIIIALQEPVSERDREDEYKNYCERMGSYVSDMCSQLVYNVLSCRLHSMLIYMDLRLRLSQLMGAPTQVTQQGASSRRII
jgi:hypothetical protein